MYLLHRQRERDLYEEVQDQTFPNPHGLNDSNHYTDTLLGKIQNFFGGKTGTGSDAKYCFTGIYKHKKKTYVTVVLGAGSPAGRWSDTKKLHSYIRSYAATKY